ncbi:protoheme IX farnesyltransferase [Bacillus canaveralius]|uniref:Protoheme IX farnesyltransferase n=1 Tax=Bacillus canaveralius TaxID=1403243 RepID=A0A2N5GNJ1_9BACI|nr:MULTISPECIES: heme o synthase [Bacillus]PLR84076.1 protoheme IX farnesyltransferase [Bacillus canaveralius]PLR87308.1 protoheme IX farnesyltransferase [Bacillus sp. V33-4]PLR96278.1 protoheme IX farnesyltransferase [Bacillus canaveralius]RSK53536.1 protoheme IX farnesyltransferase [Bacillus canaveralius]
MANTKALAEAAIDSSERSLNAKVSAANAWSDFLALIKIGIVNSNLITTFTGLWLALHFTDKGFFNNLDLVFLTLAGSSLIIAGSCSINNYIDRDIDHLMERTKERPTVTGRVNPSKVVAMGIILIGLGTLCLLLTTPTAALIGLIGVFSYVFLYTMWSKRKYVSNTIVGSVSGAVPPLIGWAAIDGSLDPIAWALFLIMFVWQPPHFYALAMRRVEEYRAAGIPMLPVVKGYSTTKKHIIVWVAALLPLPLLLTSLGIPFLILATVLNIGWFILGIYGYKLKDDIKWAKLMFIYSLQYLTIMFVAMVIVTLI